MPTARPADRPRDRRGEGDPVTTIKVSTRTRDRIRSLGRPTHEEAILDALDALEAAEFWQHAESAAARHAQLPADERRRRAARDAAIDEALEDIR